jgi:hypothetical protein
MPGLTNTWAGTRPKSVEEVLNDTAVIIANGGRLNIGEIPASPDIQPAEAMKHLAAKAAAFARERKPWTLHTQSVPMVAILHSAETHYRRVIPEPDWKIGPVKREVLSDSGNIETIEVERDPGLNRIFWRNNEIAPTYIMGAYQGLLENHIPFDIINADTYLERGSEYEMVILPEQLALKPETVRAMESYVENGGVILATGATVQSALKPLLGLSGASPLDGPAPKVAWRDETFELLDPLQVRIDAAETVTHFQSPAAQPLVTRRTVGKGQAWYVAADLFGDYYRRSPYTPWRRDSQGTDAARDFIGDLVRQAQPDLPIRIDADPWVETGIRKKAESDLLALLKSASPNRTEWRSTKQIGREKLPLPGVNDGYTDKPQLGVRNQLAVPMEKADYRDTSVVAFRIPDGHPVERLKNRRPDLGAKSAHSDGNVFVPAEKVMAAPRQPWANAPEDVTVKAGDVIDLTAKLAADGTLDWQVPAGRWVVVRTGHRMTGAKLSVPLPGMEGLENDFLGRAGVENFFQHTGQVPAHGERTQLAVFSARICSKYSRFQPARRRR